MTEYRSSRDRKRPRRNDAEGFAKIPNVVQYSAAYRTLTGESVRLLNMIAGGYTGYNNGDLQACMDDWKKVSRGSADTISRGLKQLIERGLVIRTLDAHKGFRARFALAFHPIDPIDYLNLEREERARDGWKQWEGKNNFPDPKIGTRTAQDRNTRTDRFRKSDTKSQQSKT